MIKKGLKVKVMSGRDKNKEGEIIEIEKKLHKEILIEVYDFF